MITLIRLRYRLSSEIWKIFDIAEVYFDSSIGSSCAELNGGVGILSYTEVSGISSKSAVY